MNPIPAAPPGSHRSVYQFSFAILVPQGRCRKKEYRRNESDVKQIVQLFGRTKSTRLLFSSVDNSLPNIVGAQLDTMNSCRTCLRQEISDRRYDLFARNARPITKLLVDCTAMKVRVLFCCCACLHYIMLFYVINCYILITCVSKY